MNLYQYLSPAIIFPLSFWIWYHTSKSNLMIALLAIAIPMSYGYIIAGLGTSYFKLWEFKSNFKVGQFTALHGFMFGGPSAIFSWLSLSVPNPHFPYWAILKTGFICGSVMGFWNWLFDIYAIKSGFAILKTELANQKKEPEVVATDYAPCYFGTFGFCYGIAMSVGWLAFVEQRIQMNLWILFVLLLLFCLVVPVLILMINHYLKHGYLEINSIQRKK